MSKRVHIAPYGEEWAIRLGGNIRIKSKHKTKKEAISTAQRMVCTDSSNLIIHRKNGQIIEGNISKIEEL